MANAHRPENQPGKQERFLIVFWILAILFLVFLASCAPAATIVPAPTAVPLATQPPQPTLQLAPTQPPLPTPSSAAVPTTLPATPPVVTPTSEQRMVELEWPASLRLGESDLVRLSIVPYQGSYVVQAEFPEHATQSQPVTVTRIEGFNLSGVARLEGVGFEISPPGDLEQPLPADQTVTWRWTMQPRAAGQQRLSVTLLLRWTPDSATISAIRQSQAYSKGLDVQVSSFLGLSQSQALGAGFISLLMGLGLSLGAVVVLRPQAVQAVRLQIMRPNPVLSIEPYPGLQLSDEEISLLKSLFGHYGRLVLESEFLSGYSGARTFLALPVKPGGQADAQTIVKIGWRQDIQREAGNYETFVKDSLPPMTARIQHSPVASSTGSRRAAVRYTFIAEPGRPPSSLRQALLANPDPDPLFRMFDTFGPGWWMQRRPASFRVSREYDLLLPPHLVLEPYQFKGYPLKTLSEITPPFNLGLKLGDVVRIGGFTLVEPRADGQSFSLIGMAKPGQPPLRLRWMDADMPIRLPGRVIATRETLFAGWVAGMERFGLPDPLASLPGWLAETLQGTQSIIHGDLNLENVLVGPGGFVWLIDFAQTREGHPLFDFSHLAAEIIAHIIAPGVGSPAEYLDLLAAGRLPLLAALEQIAGRCLFNPNERGEYHLSLALACLGALKYPNLGSKEKHLLYLTAAYLSTLIK